MPFCLPFIDIYVWVGGIIALIIIRIFMAGLNGGHCVDVGVASGLDGILA